jgi:hypothetical protein
MKHGIDSRITYTAITLVCLALIMCVLPGGAYPALANSTGAPNEFHGTSSSTTGLTIVTTTLPSGFVGTRYYYAVTASGGTGAYSFTIKMATFRMDCH